MLATLSGRIVFLLAILLLVLLQYKLWWGESGYYDRQALKQRIGLQYQENLKLAERNRILSAEVYDLKSGMEAVEEHARLDLGLIKPKETFVQLTMLPVPHYRAPAEVYGDDLLTNESDVCINEHKILGYFTCGR
ncbi:septum formation initiator family protein [Alkanindiges sp. WGS2144]|uniref:septum formation initiator family protein n=1 Tax=Alkanindiges sp. WGS2144 TaxID=3366808 RepID=UPI003751AC0A